MSVNLSVRLSHTHTHTHTLTHTHTHPHASQMVITNSWSLNLDFKGTEICSSECVFCIFIEFGYIVNLKKECMLYVLFGARDRHTNAHQYTRPNVRSDIMLDASYSITQC